VIYKKAFGTANKDFNAPNRVDTKFNLGSMNKMFTSVAIAQLVERGKLSFDDPLAKFLPEFPSKEAADQLKPGHVSQQRIYGGRALKLRRRKLSGVGEDA